ncbi:MAG: gliding motility lipoprotein GldH [Saprospiraceae bacterium]|nr:gliding motility lipoprotein GldH [Saprospiraceae bacterium]
MIRFPGLYFAFFLLLISCGKSHFYYGNQPISNGVWSYDDTLTYSLDIADTTSRYDIGLEVKHSTDFAFQNLYIKILTDFPDGETVSQTLPIELADHTGIWFGRCSGSHCQVGIQLQENARFDRIGQHTFRILQYMRENPINGIEKINFFLDRKPW